MSPSSSDSTPKTFTESPTSPPPPQDPNSQDVVMERQEPIVQAPEEAGGVHLGVGRHLTANGEEVTCDCHAGNKVKAGVEVQAATATATAATNNVEEIGEGMEKAETDSGIESEEEEDDRTSQNNYHYQSPTFKIYNYPPPPPPAPQCLHVCNRVILNN